MSLTRYVQRHRVGLKRSFYAALGFSAGGALSISVEREWEAKSESERAGRPPVVLRIKVRTMRTRALFHPPPDHITTPNYFARMRAFVSSTTTKYYNHAKNFPTAITQHCRTIWVGRQVGPQRQRIPPLS